MPPIVNWARSSTFHQHNQRSQQCGQALVEGVISIVMITACAVGVVLLLVNCGISVYYKEKMAFAVNQAAEFAYTVPGGANLQAATRDYLLQTLPSMGVQPRNLEVQVSLDQKIIGQPAAVVKVSNDFAMFGKGNILPLFVRMSEVGLATSPSTVVAFAGPPGPRGQHGARGPQGPPAANTFDPLEIQKAAGFGAFGTFSAFGTGQSASFPIFGGSDILFRGFPERNFFFYGPQMYSNPTNTGGGGNSGR